jgi:DNA mismatch repair protein MutH
MTKKYDDTSVDSIVSFAQSLTNHSLDEVITLPGEVSKNSNKGGLGGMVEAHFFELPPTRSGIDFPKAGLELKVTGVTQSREGVYKAKERLVLTMINYVNLVEETWDTSKFLEKCRLMLILFYLYEKDIPAADLRFVLKPFLYRIEHHDMETIRQDWERIRLSVIEGKAHELSEGDTFFLGATRKGEGGLREGLRDQPFSEVKAKARAFAFKQKYVNLLISGHTKEQNLILVGESTSLEAATLERFADFIGLSVEEISQVTGFQKSSVRHKAFLRGLSTRMIARSAESVPELDMADIEIKTIRLRSSGKPRESMSFPGFSFLGIIDEEWEDSSFFEKLEKKFLFVVFREDPFGQERLEMVRFWNMPYRDRLEAHRVWKETKSRVRRNQLPLPQAKESHVAHVRPKARNNKDTLPTPGGSQWVRQCFWLNASYIHRVLDSVRDER